MSINRVRHPKKAAIVHVIRVAMVAALLWLIPTQRPPVANISDAAPAIDLKPLSRLGAATAGAATVGAVPDANGMWPILDADGTTVAFVARTLPAATSAIGYRGPTEAAILFDRQLNVLSVELIDSADTPEHIAAVRKNERFFDQFRGWKWGGPPPATSVDGVAGATLTSLAMAKGIMIRIGGQRPSLVYPNRIEPQEISSWAGGKITLDASNDQALIYDPQGSLQGRIIRTGPLSDQVIGYQGPTELLVWLSAEDRVVDLRIRESFDNEPYVGYVRTERSFWKHFKGQTLEELATFDPEAAGVEGVSGATMTSLAIADTLVAAAKASLTKKNSAADRQGSVQAGWVHSMRWSGRDWGTLAVLAIALASARLRWFRRPLWRRIWLATAVVCIGLWTGNLVSMALIAGWSAEGIAWQLAPGLFAMVVAALVIPPLTKSNPYCSHLCPHGAFQQLIKPPSRSRRHLPLPAKFSRGLTWIPGLTLVAAYLTLILRPATELASWEPFHAYLFRIAGWASIALAVGSLIVAARIPMAYCRLGCPTGRLLDHLRRSSDSHRVTLADCVAAGLIAIASGLRWA